jgi:hypothetical protein
VGVNATEGATRTGGSLAPSQTFQFICQSPTGPLFA